MKLILSKIIFIFSLFGLFIIFLLNYSGAYYDKYAQYKQLGSNLMKVPYYEYNNIKNNEKYKNSNEYKQLNNLVKIDNIFDIASKDLEKKILIKKNNLLRKIKNKEIEDTGEREIDDEIAILDKKGRYLVLELPGNLITIKDDNFLYVYKHKITGNVNLVTRMQSIFKKYKGEKGKTKDSYGFKSELIKLFDEYGLEYKEIKGYGVQSEIYIGKNFNAKSHQNALFFISKGFTTPELETYFESKKGNKKKVYLWKYLTDDDIKYDYNIRDSQKIGSLIMVKTPLFRSNSYLGMVSDTNKILKSRILAGKIDMYIYDINKNPYEYIVLAVIFLLGILLGIYLVFNFISNYKNNFNRIPEEL